MTCQLNDRIFAVSSRDIALTHKFEKTSLLLNSPNVEATCQDFFNATRKHPKRLLHAVTKTTVGYAVLICRV